MTFNYAKKYFLKYMFHIYSGQRSCVKAAILILFCLENSMDLGDCR